MSDPFRSVAGVCLAYDEDGVPRYLGAPLSQFPVQRVADRPMRERARRAEAARWVEDPRDGAQIFSVVRVSSDRDV